MNKKIFVAVTAISLTLAASGFDPLSYPKPRCADRFDFEKRINLSTWPRSASENLSQIDGISGKAMRGAPSGNSFNAYGSMAFNKPGPGTVSVSFDYKFEKPETSKLSVACNFNLPGKSNGSAGRTSAVVQPSGDWAKFHRVFTVPEKAAAVQYVFGISGSGAGILMDNISVVYTPDSFQVPVVKKVYFNDPVKSRIWNINDLQYGFYSHGKDAITPAAMQIAADQDALCIMIRNFTDPAKIKSKVKQYDGALWNDEANEIFLFDEKRSEGWQFIVNASGTGFDAKMFQRVPGDPWRSDAKWNGKWKRSAQITDDGFVTRFYIPWKTLNIDPSQNFELKFNAAADYPSNGEYPTWSCYRGNRHDLGKYGTISVANGKMTVTRKRITDNLTYAIPRKKPQFESVLIQGVKGNYQIDTWCAGLTRSEFPASIMSRISDKQFEDWKEELFRAWSVAKVGGPAWPWLMRNTRERIVKYHEKHGMKYPFSISNSDHGRYAHKNGGVFIDPTTDWRCDVNEPLYVKAVTDFIRSRKNIGDYELMKKSVKFGLGIDEPTNSVELCFNPSVNKKNIDALKTHSEMVKKQFGFGKYGSPFFNDTPAANRPFERIAFYRWWNSELKKTLSSIQMAFEETFPGIPLLLTDDNNTAGQSNMDVANLNNVAKLISCDPYPTATNAYYGMSRALYHVGFSCRVLKDLVPSAKLMIMPQCFIYHGGYGDTQAMREWSSQALKNGAEHFMWYCAGAPAQIFKEYAGMLEISAMISSMDKVALPKKTQTLIWYSNFDKWAKSDYVHHAAYTLYAILFEHLGCNFKFISDSSLANGDIDLNKYKLMYIPQMTYTTEAISAKIAEFVDKGGILVVFDPQFMAYNIDGTSNSFRAKLTGQTTANLPVKTSGNNKLLWNSKILNNAMIANAPALPNSRFASYIINDSGSKVIARYSDNTPAIIERNYGKGKIIYSGCQPFAGSDMAVAPGAWQDFFAAYAKTVNEKTNLPIKDFLLPPPPQTVKLRQLLK